MAVWYKQSVAGDLQPVAQKGLGKVARLYAGVGADLFITSIRDGIHSLGSLHYIGLAFDFRRNDISIRDIKLVLGTNWDVVDESNHVHVEYDPK